MDISLYHTVFLGFFMQKKEQLIGAHVSVAGGLHNAFTYAQTIGANAIQIFTKSNRQWKSTPITEQAADEFVATWQQSPVQIVITHACYLINLGSSDPDIYTKSYNALVDELQRCNTLHIPYLVLHPGSNATNKQSALQQIGAAVLEALSSIPNNQCTVLFETMAGQGSSLGSTFEELAIILHAAKSPQFTGVCVDTAHIFAAGYDAKSPENYHALWEKFDTLIGCDRIKIFHINDSKKECGSRVDRHEHIGKGLIPVLFFSLLMNDTRFLKIPKILETPKENEPEDDIKNIEKLKSIIK